MAARVYTASFYDPQDWVGRPYRVSRGHPRGLKAQWDTLPFLYPERDLLQRYRRGEIGFDALAAAYRDALDARLEEDAEFRQWLEGLAHLGDFTLLCFERGERPCHRRVLARWLLEQSPGLELGDLR